MPSKLREMINPYFPITCQLAPHEFVGREREIADMCRILEEYSSTSKLTNVIVTGEKSIGKSSLLNRFKQVLQDYCVFRSKVTSDSIPS